jgi:hypothetical protein
VQLPNHDRPVLAFWEVSGETYQEMWDEAMSDATRLLAGYPHKWNMELWNCEPLNTENSQVLSWKGKVIVS